MKAAVLKCSFLYKSSSLNIWKSGLNDKSNHSKTSIIPRRNSKWNYSSFLTEKDVGEENDNRNPLLPFWSIMSKQLKKRWILISRLAKLSYVSVSWWFPIGHNAPINNILRFSCPGLVSKVALHWQHFVSLINSYTSRLAVVTCQNWRGDFEQSHVVCFAVMTARLCGGSSTTNYPLPLWKAPPILLSCLEHNKDASPWPCLCLTARMLLSCH